MALVQCKECGREMSTTASACPACGAQARSPLGCGTLLLVVVGGCGLVLALDDFKTSRERAQGAASVAAMTPEQRAAQAAQRAAADAPMMCRAFLRKHLHDPDSAEFLSAELSRSLPDGSYQVAVTVRAKNAFNAKRVGTYDCVVRPIGGGDWRLVDLKQRK